MTDKQEQYPHCTYLMVEKGKAHPRSCKHCGIGPCKSLRAGEVEFRTDRRMTDGEMYELPCKNNLLPIDIGGEYYEVPIRVHVCVVGLRMQVEALDRDRESYRKVYKEQQAEIDALKRRLRSVQEQADNLAENLRVG